jgi:pimeloyl-ACP methyl ester carboxylesterase
LVGVPARIRRTLLGLSLVVLPGLACQARNSETPAPPPRLSQTPTATVAELCTGGLRSWAVLGEGGKIVASSRGTCLGRVEHPEEGPLWHFVAQLQGRGAERPSWELHTWLDDEGHPRHAEFRTPEVVTHFRWQEGALVVHRLGDRLRIEDGGQLWVTPGHGVYVRELMLRLGVGLSGESFVQRSFAPAHDAITELALHLEHLDDDRAQARIEGEDPGGVLALEGAAAGLAGLKIATVLAGDAPIYRPLAEDELAPFLPAHPRPSYRPPEQLELSPIEIAGEAGEPTLAAELVLGPAAEDADPRPGVLFLAGAGPQDRHGFVPDSSVDLGSHELHDALAAAGFAVLRFDDRGVGDSEIGDDPTPGFSALVDDARRALASLAADPRVDPSRIILIGHGEGALVASILAAEGVRARGRGRKRRVAGLVLLAGPARNLRELVYDEIRASLADRREGEIRTAVDRARRVHEAALAGEELPASSEGAREWMVEAFAEDPLARLAKVRAPVLALQGGKDFQVSAERDFEPIRALLETKGPRGSAAELFPELDHLFKPEPGISTPGHYADLRRHLDPSLIERVEHWALGRVSKTQP